MSKLKIKHSNEKMVIVPFQEYTELQEFKSKMENENTIFVNEVAGLFGRHSYYTTSDTKMKEVLEELKVCKALETDLESQITILSNRVFKLESMGFWEFIKKRYFTKKSKPMK